MSKINLHLDNEYPIFIKIKNPLDHNQGDSFYSFQLIQIYVIQEIPTLPD